MCFQRGSWGLIFKMRRYLDVNHFIIYKEFFPDYESSICKMLTMENL